MRRRAPAWTCAAAVALLVSGALPAAAGAVTPAASAPTPTAVTLTAQPAWSAVGSDLPLHVDLGGDTAGLSVEIVAHAGLTSRSAFQGTLRGRNLGPVLGTTSYPVASLPVDQLGTLVDVPLQDPDAPRDPDRVPLAPARGNGIGVFPVEVRLVDPITASTVSSFVTYAVVARVAGGALAAGRPLGVAWIWRLGAAPVPASLSGSAATRAAASFDAGSRLGTIAGTLPGARGVPLTLVPTPETVEAWAELGRAHPSIVPGLDHVRAAAADPANEVIGGPYVGVDLPAMLDGGLGDHVGPQFAQGAATLQDVLGHPATAGTAILSTVGPASVARLQTLGVSRLVLDPSSFPPPPGKFTVAQPFEVAGPGPPVTAVVTDPDLAALLTGPGPGSPALQAQQVLSALALTAAEQPNVTRGVVLAAPATWAPSAALLQAIVAGLRQNPLLTPRTVDALVATVPPATEDGRPLQRAPDGRAVQPLAVTARAVDAADGKVAALANLLGPDDSVVARSSRSVLSSMSDSYVGASGRRAAEADLASVDDAVDAVVAGVHTATRRNVTLTARQASIPVSFENTTGRELQVVVTLASDRLLFPDGSSQRMELPPRNTTARFAVETRTSGTFPMSVQVTSTDGRIRFEPARFTVHSTVVSGVGLFLTIGAGVFLAGWWIDHARRTRRARTRLSRVDAPAPARPPTPA